MQKRRVLDNRLTCYSVEPSLKATAHLVDCPAGQLALRKGASLGILDRRTNAGLGCTLWAYTGHADGYSKPEVEVQDSPELLLPAVTVRRTDLEECLIEPSYNSVRISFKASQEDALGALLQQRLLSFLTRGSYVEALGIIRRRAVPGYHLSFLVMASHCQTYAPHGLVEAICGFLEGLPAAFGFRLSVTSQGRSVGAEYLRGFLPRQRRQQAA